MPKLADLISYIQTELQIESVYLLMQNICELQFDLSKPVLLLHPNNKFWKVTLNGVNVTFRVGKVKEGVQSGEEQVQKRYPSIAAAKASVVQKINQKLTKGYISNDAKAVPKTQEIKKQEKKQANKVIRKGDNKFKAFSGEYYESADGKRSIKIQVNGTRVKTTKTEEGKKEEVKIEQCKNQQDAILGCMQEQEWIKKEGYRPMSHKFIYSFIDEEREIKKEKTTRPKKQAAGKNVLSITDMTDDAMSRHSRNNSEAKSQRSYISEDQGSFADTKSKLGPPTSGCIKVLLAQTYKQGVDPSGWIMSQKLDGVRCFWTGSVMYSRNGNRFFFPKFFTKNWPNSQLDGELFIGRGKFSQTISAIKKGSPIDDEWKKVKYLVFDCPGLKKPFKNRIKAMEEVLSEIDNPYIKCHAHRQCKGFTDLFQQLEKVNKIEGQGLMLREPDSMYENRRSNSLLKVKTFYDDEAVVLGYNAGTGRCTGMVGALRVRNTHGVQFQIGSGLTDHQRRHPPKVGTKVTYKYQEFNKDSGKPRFPTYVRPYEHI